MNIIGIDYESVVDGEGVRTVIFFSGCLHGCLGCHNPDSHDFNAGKELTKEVEDEIFYYIKATPYISGITLSGGDPFWSAAEIIPFVKRFKEKFPNKTIWAYTGFDLEEVLLNEDRRELFKLCDVLVDGRFDVDKKGFALKFRGSANQRIIKTQDSLKSGRVVLLTEQ